MVEGGMKCIKYLLFAFNLVFFLVGVGLIAAGAYVQVAMKGLMTYIIEGTSVNGPAIFLIVVGVIVFIFAFFGCCGAIKENYCMVLAFSIMLGVIFVFEISAGIAAYVLKDAIVGYVDHAPFTNATDCCVELRMVHVPCESINGTSSVKTCITAVEDTLQTNIYVVGAVGIAFGIIQIVGVVLACCLARAVRKEYEVA